MAGSNLAGRQVAIIGAGPAGLIAAETIAKAGVSVTIYDRMPSPARKFLLAGRGGLNLTHSEPFEDFLARYGAAAPYLRPVIEAFPPHALRAWSEGLGQKTFVGSSGRVFPEAFKASPLLRVWLRQLDDLGVRFVARHRWIGWDASGALRFQTPDGERFVTTGAALLALGGVSWPRLGSDGAWRDVLIANGIDVAELLPANCGFRVVWSDVFRDRFEGEPLKTIALSFGTHTVRGEAIVTRDGLEGGGIYALSAPLREEIVRSGRAMLHLDLRPDLSLSELATRLSSPRGKQSFSNFLRKTLSLPPVGIGLLQESSIREGMPLADMAPALLAERVKTVPIPLTGIAPIEKAISTAGGVLSREVNPQFMLHKMPGVFVAGEMLDWEAPTGGYLLQASFATGVAAGKGILEFLRL
ncbi:MAG: TIGR03862 family flavoprotein [Xanthobacteraceae bacterium]|nr:TIGR03862 family flavoprotein [Xanthobacteraceae bacterium]